MYKKVSDLLSRFSKITQESETFYEKVLSIIKEEGIILTSKEISLKGGVLIIKTSPIKKTQLFLKQEKILETLKKTPATAHVLIIK